MPKNLKISLLLDFYGPLLTEKQQESIEYYYNHDLSLAEIAQHTGITRQGVRDSIKRGEALLLEYEEKLKLFDKYHQRQLKIEEIIACAQAIQEENQRFGQSQQTATKAQDIIDIANQLGN